jgi:alcohol dehydrogenase
MDHSLSTGGGAHPFSFSLPTRVRFGVGELRALAGETRALGMERPLLVTDSVLVKAPQVRQAVQDCRTAGLALEAWDGVVPNPTDACVHEGWVQYRSSGCDGLIACGGGSSIDTAKAIGVLASGGQGEIQAFFQPEPASIGPLPPLIALPTTAGTGSEVTWVSIITSSATGRKAVIRDRALFPAVSIVDPALTYSMPPDLTSHTGLDAFSHAVETYTSRLQAPFSETLAFRSMELIVDALPRAVREGMDHKARYRMSMAATMAGMAFTNSMLHTGHHISHVLTSRYHFPHGLACILTIPAMLAYLRPAVGAKIARLAPLFGAPPDLSQERAEVWAVQGVRAFISEVGVPSIETISGDTGAAIPGLVAEQLGGGSERFAMEVKGLEFPAYDPRAGFGTGLTYAVTARGACHRRAWPPAREVLGSVPPYTIEGKAAMVKEMFDERTTYHSLLVCDYAGSGLGISFEEYAEFIEAVTGHSYTLEDLAEAADRIETAIRLFNVREGLGRKDDTLPARILEEPLPDGPARGQLFGREGLETMKDEYYALRGWDNEGVPLPETLERYGVSSKGRG